MKEKTKEQHVHDEIKKNTEVAYDIASSSYSKIKEDFIKDGGDIPLLAAAHAVLLTFGNEECINMIDIGCGTGHDMLLFPEMIDKISNHEYKVQCTGCDLSGKMIEICKAKGLEVVKGDFLAVSAEFNNAHLLWSHMSLIHLPIDDIQAYLNKFFDLTLPKGFLVIGYKKAKNDQEVIQPKSERIHVERFTNYLTEKTVCEKLKIAGFKKLLITLEIPSEHDEYNYGYVVMQRENK